MGKKERKSFNPDLKDIFEMRARHDSCWRSDGFSHFNEISKDIHRTWLHEIHFMNLGNNLDYELGSDEWNSTFTFNMYQKTITRNKE